MTRVVAADRVLDLDHPRTEIREDHRAIRSGQHAREIENGDAVEGSRHGVILSIMEITVYSGSH